MSAGIKAHTTYSALLHAGVEVVKFDGSGLQATAIPDSSITPTKLTQPLTLSTAQATTSGTAIDFTGIPSWVKRITVIFNGVSTNGTSPVQVQLGASGTPATSGYLGAANANLNAGAPLIVNPTTGFYIMSDSAAGYVRYGHLILTNPSGNIWVASGVGGDSGSARTWSTGGNVTLGGTMNMIRLTTVSGADTFDAGSINIMYE